MGGRFAEEGFVPLNLMMKHVPYIFGWIGVAHTITPGVGRFMDGVLLGDVPKYKSGAMVMSKKDGLGLGLFSGEQEVHTKIFATLYHTSRTRKWQRRHPLLYENT